MIFSLQKLFYKSLMLFLRVILKLVALPRPTVYAGTDSSLQLCNSIIQFGYKRVLIVTDKALHEMGLIDPVKERLGSANVIVTIYDGVEPNPTFAQVKGGLALVKSNQCDAILAFGGGSSIDAAKVISLAATNDMPPEKLVGTFKAKKPGLPLFAIPTTAGTGSEASIAAVISDPITHQKGIVGDPKTVPTAAALDPKIMLGLPPAITAATGMDALTHAIEAYLSTLATEESDSYALASAKLIFANLRKAYVEGSDIQAREGMAIASFYAALAFNQTALGYVHGIAHQFSAYYNTPHGLANAIVLPHVLDFQKDACEKRMANLALTLELGSESESVSALAQKFVNAIRELNNYLEIPSTLSSLKSVDIPRIAKAALKESHYNYAVPEYMNQKRCEILIAKMVA